MQAIIQECESPLVRWIDKEKTILDMYVNLVSSDPDMLNDYEGTVRYLNEMNMFYPEISASYMADPAIGGGHIAVIYGHNDIEGSDITRIQVWDIFKKKI